MAVTISGNLRLSGSMQVGGVALSVPSQATNVSPANGATHVAYAPTITWTNGGGALTYKVYCDTSNPPTTLVQNSGATSYASGALSFGTVYYLRIDPVNNSGTTTGSVYSFTTESVFDVDGYASLNVSGNDGDALTTARLNVGTQVSLGLWSLSSNAVGASFVSGSPTPLYSPVRVASNVYTGDSDTRAIKFRMDTRDNDAWLNLTSTVPKMSIGFWITIGPIAPSNATVIDLLNCTTALGGFSVAQLSTNGLLHIHTETNSSSQTGADIPGTTLGTPYWCTMYCDQHGQPGATDVLKLYDLAGTLVGTSSANTAASTSKASNYTAIRLGRSDGHAGNNDPPATSYVTYSQLAIDTTSPAYPLGP